MADTLMDRSPAVLLADLGDLAQAALCFVHGHSQRLGVFEFSVNAPLDPWNYLVFAGLETLLHELGQFRVPSELVEYLRQHAAFATIPSEWYSHLAQFKFQGEVWSVREGSVVFPTAPLVRIVAPLDAGMLLKSYLTGALAAQIRLASHMSRLVTAAAERVVIYAAAPEWGEAALGIESARSAYLAGVISTTSVEAARRYGIPTQHLMPATWPLLVGKADEATRAYSVFYPTTYVAIVDSLTGLEGLRSIITSGVSLQAVRVIRDPVTLPREVRRLLDQSQRRHTKIYADVGVEEHLIERLVQLDAPLDGFVISSSQAASENTPVFKSTYGLVAVANGTGNWDGRACLTPVRESYPLPKQVYRQHADDGSFTRDIIGLESEQLEGEPLLAPVMRQGELCGPLPTLEESRDHCVVQRIRLPVELLELESTHPVYPVVCSSKLEDELTRLVASAK
jgi:nicotinate phosphoribosyltransferase